jgi:hypothetical protein
MLLALIVCTMFVTKDGHRTMECIGGRSLNTDLHRRAQVKTPTWGPRR